MAAQIPPRMTDEERARQMRLQAQQPVYGPGNPPPPPASLGGTNPGLRAAQGATDAAMQAGAVRNADNAQRSLLAEAVTTRAAQGATDAAMQAGAVRNADNAQQRGQLTAQTPGNPARAAQMQAQFDQPVTIGSPAQAPAPQLSARNPNAINVGQAAGDVVLGALSTPGAALADLARFRGAQALGGDVGTLAGGVNPRLDAAQNRISGGLSQLGQATSQAFQPVGEAISGARSTALGALGAQATQPTSQPTLVTTPGVTPTTGAQAQPQAAQTMTANQVRDQDRANLAALVSSQPDFVGPAGGQPGTTLSPDILADANQRIAQTLAQSRTMGPQPGAERGDFNQATTSRVGPDGQITSALRQPTNIIEGGYGGFGAGRGTAYLQQMAQQDQQEAARFREQRQSAQEDVERIGLRNAMTQGTQQERRAARQQMEALDQRAGARVSEGGATERQAMQLRGAELTAQTSGAAAMQAAQTRAAAQQQAAEITGRYGLQRAETTALGRVGAAEIGANSGANLLAQQRAQQLAIQQQLMLQAQEAGDVSGTFAAAGLSRPPEPQYTDPLTGAPLSAEQVRRLQQQALSRLAP